MAQRTRTPLRTTTGWALFCVARRLLAASGRTLRSDCPLAHIARGVAERLDRAPRRSAEPV